jgi:hypothetical protein
VIINPESIQNKYKCNKILADYLIYKKGLPLLSIDNGNYYFTDNEILQDALSHLPLHLKVLKHF